MTRKNTLYPLIFLGLALFITLLLAGPSPVEAGIFRASQEVTYKEYWVPHSQFTGGCKEDGSPTHPAGNAFYFEPFTLWSCPKTVAFSLPDNFTNAEKIEVYIDLWRNYDSQSARFKINDGATIYNPGVGSNWSRTPAIMEIPKSEFKIGANTMTFWGSALYHVHDIGIRIYYTDAKPLLLAGSNNAATAPTGQLVAITDDSTTVSPAAGGVLTVNNNKLTLRAENLSPDTAYVEFHAWYEGYDEDNDGVFRDWHNLGRNNWWPGGTEQKSTGGVINHIGTKATGGATSAEVAWDLAHITNQAKIKFKIRVVDAAGNVREAAGGESAEFRMMRAAPANAFIIHGFTDFGLYMDGKRPETATYSFTMPLNLSQFNTAYLVGAYWKNPKFSVNGNGGSAPVTVEATDWSLGIKSFTKSWLLPGANQIVYSWWTGFGAFVEEPGPMFVLRNTSAASDNAAPVVSKQTPAPNAKNVAITSSVIAHIGDEIYGVDWTTVKFKVNGVDRTAKAQLKGVMGDYQLVYTPDTNWAYGTDYNIAIDACDMKGNCMPTVNYKFTIVAADTTPPVISNVKATPTSIGAAIGWNTNEPASSLVDYGLTTSYELGTIEATTLKTSHSVQITGLQSGKLYHYRVRGTDAQGNTGQSADNTFTTLQFSAFISDDFRACALNNSLWQFVNPKGDVTPTLNDTQIEFTIPAGSSHDWSAGGPPRFLQNIANSNLAIEIKFDSVVSQIGQMQGLIIEESPTTYVRVVFERNAAGEPIMRTDFVRNGVVQNFILYEFAKSAPTHVDPPPFMKITRDGDTWKMYWSTDGTNSNWTWANPGKTFAMSVVRAGFFGGNSGEAGAQPQHKVVVDYIFNSNAKIVPEDGAPFSINVTIMGDGAVTKTPPQSVYTCGDTVKLNAIPSAGWSFAGWSGDASGDDLVIDVVVERPMNVVATFIKPQYTLDVAIVGDAGNSVTVTPQKALYSHGEVVVLEAKPKAGWYFTGWSGSGLSGAQNPLTLSMEANRAITATFSTNAPPVFEAVADQVIGTGQTLTFQVQAGDPGGDLVTLAYMPLPAGATFVNNGNGQGTFSWQPTVWQGGEYEVTFIASDGSGQSSLTVKITVQGMSAAIPMVIGSGQ